MRQNLDELHYELAGEKKGSREPKVGERNKEKSMHRKSKAGGASWGRVVLTRTIWHGTTKTLK